MAAQFIDRDDAARQLAQALSGWRGQHPLILAIPRGGLPMGLLLARQLEGDLDVVLVRKLANPYDPEYAIAAVDEAGRLIPPPDGRALPDAARLEEERQKQHAVLTARRNRYDQPAPRQGVAGRAVIIVDDGLATGSTMATALQSIRAQHPARLCCAVPVAASSSLALVRPLADEVVCLRQPEPFHAVSLHYRHFEQVSDAEAEAALQQAAALGKAQGQAQPPGHG